MLMLVLFKMIGSAHYWEKRMKKYAQWGDCNLNCVSA